MKDHNYLIDKDQEVNKYNMILMNDLYKIIYK